MATDSPDEDFQQELLELFSAEAGEWLSQARQSLLQLQQGSKPEESPQLLDVIQTSMTNLGGSAATVDLPEVEQLAYSLLPVLESLRSLGGSLSPEQCQSLMDRIHHIGLLVQKLGFSAPPPVPSAAEPASSTLFEKLCNLQKGQAQAGLTERNIMQVLLQLLRDNPKPDGPNDSALVTKFLRELEGQDEELLKKIEEDFEQVFQAMALLKRSPESFETGSTELESALVIIDILQSNAIHVRAMSLARFFQGLQAFFNVISEQGVAIVAQRIAAVESRLGAVVPMAQQWVEMGRIEREAISKVLST